MFCCGLVLCTTPACFSTFLSFYYCLYSKGHLQTSNIGARLIWWWCWFKPNTGYQNCHCKHTVSSSSLCIAWNCHCISFSLHFWKGISLDDKKYISGTNKWKGGFPSFQKCRERMRYIYIICMVVNLIFAEAPVTASHPLYDEMQVCVNNFSFPYCINTQMLKRRNIPLKFLIF